MRKSAVLSVLFAAVLLVASPALAQSVKGENVVVVKDSSTTKLASGKSYVTTGNHQVFLTSDPKHPMNGASGDCDGACVIDGSNATCMGSCTAVDADGDIAFFTWDGQNDGSWKLAGGSGKWKGSSGQGTWKSSSASAAGNFARNAWEGSISMVKK